jgi:hypothetical protein
MRLCMLVITVILLDITYRPVFYLKYNVYETKRCLRLQVVPTQLGPTRRRRQKLVSEMSCSVQKTGRWMVFRIVIIILL